MIGRRSRQTPANDPTIGEPSKTFGTIKFDDNGNVIGGGVGDDESMRCWTIPLIGSETTAVPRTR